MKKPLYVIAVLWVVLFVWQTIAHADTVSSTWDTENGKRILADTALGTWCVKKNDGPLVILERRSPRCFDFVFTQEYYRTEDKNVFCFILLMKLAITNTVALYMGVRLITQIKNGLKLSNLVIF